MIFKKLKKNHVSETDQFLAAFDAEHPEKSASQLAEIAKHEKIAQLRDHVMVTENKDPFAF